MDENHVDDRKRKWFLWGIVVAWAPFIPTIIGMSYTFRGVAEQKATGIGAIAGGLAEAYMVFGLVLTVVSQVGAIVLLIRSFSGEKWMRSVVALFSIAWCTLMLFLFGVFQWILHTQIPHRTGMAR